MMLTQPYLAKIVKHGTTVKLLKLLKNLIPIWGVLLGTLWFTYKGPWDSFKRPQVPSILKS